MSESDITERPRVVLVNRSFVVRQDKKILIIKRAENDSNNPGKWEVPGGKLDAGQDLTDAREREVLEETGLYVIATNKNCFVEGCVLGQNRKYPRDSLHNYLQHNQTRRR